VRRNWEGKGEKGVGLERGKNVEGERGEDREGGS